MASNITQEADFQVFAQQWTKTIDSYLLAEKPTLNLVAANDPLWEQALCAAIFDGGKRTRPLLTILGWQVVEARLPDAQDSVLKVAAAMEYIHCSSLIFDDLPCMDNATLRRGSQALHREFGQDKAILIALSLLIKGMDLVIKAGLKSLPSSSYGELLSLLINTIGSTGLICGQWFDLSAKQSEIPHKLPSKLAAQLTELRNLKTMPLLKLALTSGAILGGATAIELAALGDFAQSIGSAYQLIDDLLDLISDSKYSGKDTSLDLRNDRLNTAHQDINQIISQLQHTLGMARIAVAQDLPCGDNYQYLDAFVRYLVAQLNTILENIAPEIKMEQFYSR